MLLKSARAVRIIRCLSCRLHLGFFAFFLSHKLQKKIQKMDLIRSACSSEAGITGYRAVNCRGRASPNVLAIVGRGRTAPSVICKASAYVNFEPIFLSICHLVCRPAHDAPVQECLPNSVEFAVQRFERWSGGRTKKNAAQGTRSSSGDWPNIEIDDARGGRRER